MQTVNFLCGHCGKLMAVGVENVGQQVRCPHCTQVVLAPAAPEATAPEPASPFGDLNRHEDIFNIRRETEDVLFGENDAPKLKMQEFPLETTTPPAAPLPDLTPVSESQQDYATLPFTPPAPEPITDSVPETRMWTPSNSPEPVQDSSPGFTPTVKQRRREGGSGFMVFVLLVFMPVLLWAIGASLLGVWMYYEALKATRQSNDPFEAMPDTDGDVPGMKKGKMQTRGYRLTTKEFALRKMPEHLKVGLNEPIRVGDLEVTALKVERRKVAVFVEGFDRPEPCIHDSLVLTLKVKNHSEIYSFTPFDNYFDRHYTGKGVSELVPLTVLQAGKENYFGGPCKWYPTARKVTQRLYREWLAEEGRKDLDKRGLAPGEEMTSCVATDGGMNAGHIALHLFGEGAEKKQQPYRGELLWRVHLRRGAYHYKGRDLPASCVVGIKFTDKDYMK